MLISAAVFGVLVATRASAQSSVADAYLVHILANIGPSGSKSSGAFPGIVIASPSTENPNYLYTWTRDSALTFQTIIDQYTLGLDTSLRGEIDNYVAAQAIIQQISNPSGEITSGGLGEPKFYINETAFTDPWGYVFSDGPALRSTALITWANYLLSEGNTSYVTDTLWPIISNDLNYVAQNWNRSTFDLWEEIYSSSFFTTSVQHRALRQGVALAQAIDQASVVSEFEAQKAFQAVVQTSVVTEYETQAAYLLCFLQSYWNPSGYITANSGGGRSGIDSNTVLASIHTFDKAAGCDPLTFQPCSDVALLNLLTYVNAFRGIYDFNSGRASNEAILTGRYPEDVYFDGNPWYLTTLAVAEQLYDALLVWESQRSLDVTNISLPFFQLFDSNISAGTYASSSSKFSTLTSAVKTFSDGFVAAVANYTPSGGGLSEQISKVNGTPISAVDLTWSYASVLTAINARNGIVPTSWGAQGLSLKCTGAPAPQTVSVTFNVNASTVLGAENVYLTGSIDALKNWSPDNALALSSDNYPLWSVTLTLPGSTNVQYKYIKKDGSGTVIWESDPNMELTTPANGTLSTYDTWR
ncbi:carbohydrate-binding module family 20 protein [Collybiopsis luxurians FD-317 M1]|nr:carbohydrate-binding module family 20 protein [Collybiopsis luxurians FD-317 M1]